MHFLLIFSKLSDQDHNSNNNNAHMYSWRAGMFVNFSVLVSDLSFINLACLSQAGFYHVALLQYLSTKVPHESEI